MKKDIVIECNNYSGIASEERCRTIEEYVTKKISSECNVLRIKMNETQIQDNLIQPTLVIRFENGNNELLIGQLDQALLEIGVTAINAIISKIVSRAVEAALVGGGIGLLAGSRSDTLATTVIGALIGGLIGSSIEKGIIELVATKEFGKWITGTIPQIKGE